jgi:glycosyltransferase involved in cell wall biosynthesis
MPMKKTSLVRQASQEFSKGNYQLALALYRRLSKELGFQNFKANILLCEKRLGDGPTLCVHGTAQVPRLREGISVIIPSYKGEATLESCLVSLARQSLSHLLFEVILVINGPRDSSEHIAMSVKNKFPDLDLRIFFLDRANVSNARNYGLSVAEREYLTFVDDDDQVSVDYLQSLFDEAEQNTLVVSKILDSRNGSLEDNPINQQICAASGKTEVSYNDVSSVLTMNACKLVPTCQAKQLLFDDALRSGEDVDYWMRYLVKFSPRIRVLPKESHAVYKRLVREVSVSRQLPSFDFNVTQRLDVIRKLDRIWLQTEDVALRDFIGSKIRAQAQFVVRYLESHRDAYVRFNNLVQEYDIRFPFVQYVNSRLAQTLVISYCFPPYIDTAGIVTAKRIREMREPVDVISNTLSSIRRKDLNLNFMVSDLLGNFFELNAPASFSNWIAIEKFCDAALSCIAKRRDLRGRYRRLYSRAMWPGSHFAAAAYKAQQPSVAWVAEFSDPLLFDINGKRRDGNISRLWLKTTGIEELLYSLGLKVPEEDGMFLWCEYLPYALADQIIFTNENQLEYMLGYIGDSSLVELVCEKAVVKPQPTLSNAYYNLVECSSYSIDDRFVNLGYFGSFYQRRGLDEILIALRSIPAPMRSKIKLHIFTEQSDRISKDCSFADLASSIVINKYVEYFEFLNLSTKFDCLIVNDAETRGVKNINPYLPSKLSDYMGSGRPVWAICEPGSSMDKFAQTGKIAYRSEVGNISSHEQILVALLRGKT